MIKNHSANFRIAAVILIGILGGIFPASQRQQLAAQANNAPKLKFEIYADAAEGFRWRLKSANGEILATGGQAYKAKADCKNGVDRIKSDVATDKLKFEIYENDAKESRWRLHASNGQIIAISSQGYKAKADCEKSVALIKQGAAGAEVEDQTLNPAA